MCEHRNVKIWSRFVFLKDTKRAMLEIRLGCKDCGEPYQFLGLPVGVNLSGAAVDLDGQTVYLAVAPSNRVMSPFQQMTTDGQSKN